MNTITKLPLFVSAVCIGSLFQLRVLGFQVFQSLFVLTTACLKRGTEHSQTRAAFWRDDVASSLALSKAAVSASLCKATLATLANGANFCIDGFQPSAQFDQHAFGPHAPVLFSCLNTSTMNRQRARTNLPANPVLFVE